MINRARVLPNNNGGTTFSANVTGLGIDISDMGEKDIIVWPTSGSLTASIQIQVSALPGTSPPGAADPSWVNLGAAITTASATHTLTRALWMRAVVSGYSSGVPQIEVVGELSSELGGRKASG